MRVVRLLAFATALIVAISISLAGVTLVQLQLRSRANDELAIDAVSASSATSSVSSLSSPSSLMLSSSSKRMVKSDVERGELGTTPKAAISSRETAMGEAGREYFFGGAPDEAISSRGMMFDFEDPEPPDLSDELSSWLSTRRLTHIAASLRELGAHGLADLELLDERQRRRLWLEAALGAATAGESVEAAVAHFESIAPQATQRARGAAPHSSL